MSFNLKLFLIIFVIGLIICGLAELVIHRAYNQHESDCNENESFQNQAIFFDKGKCVPSEEHLFCERVKKCSEEIKPECNFGDIIFLHSLTCPHCQTMMPIIEELEAEGYDFYWTNSQDTNREKIQECYREVMSGYVPEFICSKTKQKITGAVPKEQQL